MKALKSGLKYCLNIIMYSSVLYEHIAIFHRSYIWMRPVIKIRGPSCQSERVIFSIRILLIIFLLEDYCASASAVQAQWAQCLMRHINNLISNII